MIKGIIFDLDGVIVSTDEQHYLAWKKLADRLGIYFDRSINNRFRGVSRMACMDILEEIGGEHFSKDQKIEMAEWKNDRYKENLKCLSEDSVSDDVRMVLEKLKQMGIKAAIGSSSKNTKYILGKIGLEKSFDAIADGTDISRSKPDPEVFLKAAEFLDLLPEECLVVEDAIAGVKAAHAANMKAATVGDAAANNCGDYLLTGISDLISIIE